MTCGELLNLLDIPVPNEQHIVTAWSRDYSDVTPLQGVIFEGGGSQQLAVSVDVKRL